MISVAVNLYVTSDDEVRPVITSTRMAYVAVGTGATSAAVLVPDSDTAAKLSGAFHDLAELLAAAEKGGTGQ